ncbi:MAG: hypothetical protein IPM24_18500 [Bryobacterales bacterium]|nr:hypothetical protein [Bryobacterales bacterium]
MKRTIVSGVFAALLGLGWIASTGIAQGPKVSGQGAMKFRVLYTASHLPPEAQASIKAAHGGFAVDTRPGKGETYFAIKGAGIIQISPDLKRTRMLKTPAAMKDTNMHNATIWFGPNGTPYLTFPGNESRQVFTTDLNGTLVHTLAPPPAGTDLGHPEPTNYFKSDGPFIPTDVEYLDGMFYIATGYSKLDYVLTARVQPKPFQAVWHDLSFGGKGTGVGQFGTGHGITVPPGTRRIDVADRPHSEIDRFTRYGQYISTLSLPQGSFPCDIDYLGNYATVGALHGPDRTKGAPIYILENDRLISTIMAKEELGLETFQHIHNAVMRQVGGKYYLIVQAWNPGDFAILEQVI